MFTSHLLLAVAWIFYGILHSVLADRKVKQYIMRRTGPLSRYYRSFYNILALSLFALLILWLFSMETRNVWTPVFPQFIAGMMMFIPGIIGIVLILKKYFVTSQGFKDLFYEGGKPVLVTDGLHRFVRHPLIFQYFFIFMGSVPVITFMVIAGHQYSGHHIYADRYQAGRKKTCSHLWRTIYKLSQIRTHDMAKDQVRS